MVHKFSFLYIFFLTCFGLLFLYVFIGDFDKHIDPFDLGCLLIGSVLLGCSVILLGTRIQNKGYYFDEEGIVFSLRGSKIFWGEIQSISYRSDKAGKSTVIYIREDSNKEIRKRLRKKYWNATYVAIIWSIVSKPKKFHNEIMAYWEKYEKDNEI